MKKWYKNLTFQYILLCTLLLVCAVIYVPIDRGHPFDTYCWRTWTNAIFGQGIGQVYSTGADYLPLYYYVLKFFGWLKGSTTAIHDDIYQLRYFIMSFHFVNGYILLRWLRQLRPDSSVLWVLIYFLNIGLLFNTLIWGQVDVVLSSMVLLSLYFAQKSKVILAIIFYVLAINFKLQAIIFLPIVGLLILPHILRTFSLKRLTLWIGTIVILQFVILIPFILEGTVDQFWKVVTKSMGKYPVVSMNAYNLWDLLLAGDLMKTPDDIIWLGLNYKSWGLLLFFALSGWALWPMLKTTITSIVRDVDTEVSIETLVLSSALVGLIFFYFNTQMHERYSHPALLFVSFLVMYRRYYLLGLIAGVAYFLNLFMVLEAGIVERHPAFYFDRTFISFLFLGAIIMLFYYQLKGVNKDI